MYISTREMVISIICNACGVLGLILWAIEAHKSNASQRIQSIESAENNGDIIVRSNLEPFRVIETDTPQTKIKTGCSRCEAKRRCRDADSEVARWCNNYNKDTQTDCGWK